MSETSEPKTAVTIRLPVEAAEKLMALWKENPEAVQAKFKEFGIPLLEIKSCDVKKIT